jgi:hypothetical protein
MNNSELLKGLSIEELQERDEFIAAAEPDGNSHCVICEC